MAADVVYLETHLLKPLGHGFFFTVARQLVSQEHVVEGIHSAFDDGFRIDVFEDNRPGRRVRYSAEKVTLLRNRDMVEYVDHAQAVIFALWPGGLASEGVEFQVVPT